VPLRKNTTESLVMCVSTLRVTFRFHCSSRRAGDCRDGGGRAACGARKLSRRVTEEISPDAGGLCRHGLFPGGASASPSDVLGILDTWSRAMRWQNCKSPMAPPPFRASRPTGTSAFPWPTAFLLFQNLINFGQFSFGEIKML